MRRSRQWRWLGVSVSLLLVGCQGGVNHGTSGHVAVGRVEGPTGAMHSPAVPRAVDRPQSPPAARPAPTQAPQPIPAAAPVTRVQVLPANPQQGVPLGDDAEIEVISLPRPDLTPTPPAASAATSSVPAVLAPLPAAASQRESQPTEEETPSWLARYPNLAQDLQGHQETIQSLEQELRQYQQRLSELQQQVRQRWGEAATTATNAHQFVKYTDAFQSRGAMDFDQGRVVVETLDPNQPRERLREAIVTTLLTPFDAENPEIYSDRAISYSGPALLAGQVLDHEGVPVRWEWRANRYADYLVENQLQEVQRDGRTIYRVEIPLVENHTQVRGQQFESLVRQASQRYNVDETLIYAIMETESHFNPYATSHIPAYGLMQIVPSTAGRDVFQRIKQRNDQPTRDYLFNPANNIDMGAAYLSILRDIYLKDITHPLSREYAIISGYNGGAGNVLRTFHSDRRQAVQVINQLTPEQVYHRLHHNHPAAEARGYIRKVTEAQQRYRALAAR
ncbi:membrane-bound lytic murein transglycosylase MltC [Marinospirillum sp.]|uniref:membrane-bound lytic murein transglycosylase MltC n=1 Tax=Marinospirillum sp. TaxID=2183934 RepID=UPI003A878431